MMGVPQIILIVLFAMSFTISLCKHGEPKTGFESAWISLFAIAIHVGLLWWGGFFS
jgi:hypothetical protein